MILTNSVLCTLLTKHLQSLIFDIFDINQGFSIIIFLWATKDRRQFKDRCLRAK